MQRSGDGGGLTQKGGYCAGLPDIACPLKKVGVVCRGSVDGGMGTEFEGVVGGEHENEWGRAFSMQNQKLSCLGSVSV
jgi:hypothetical protein